jgi:hypothetical protein
MLPGPLCTVSLVGSDPTFNPPTWETRSLEPRCARQARSSDIVRLAEPAALRGPGQEGARDLQTPETVDAAIERDDSTAAIISGGNLMA